MPSQKCSIMQWCTRSTVRCDALRAIVVIGTLALAVSSAPLLAQESSHVDEPTTDLGRKALMKRVDHLLQQLDAADRTTRETARCELLSLGTDALSVLPAPQLLPNDAVRHTVRQVRRELELQAAEQSLRPTHVSLDGEMSIAEIARQVTSQTENRVDVTALSERQRSEIVRVDWSDVSFWRAMQTLSKRVPCQFTVTTGDEQPARVALMPDVDSTTPVPLAITESGSLCLRLLKLEWKPNLTEPDRPRLRMTVGIMLEPRLRPLFVKYAEQDLRVIDDEATWDHFNPAAQQERPLSDRGEIQLTVDWLSPATSNVPKTIDIAGEMTIVVAASEAEFVFAEPFTAIDVSRRRGGVEVVLQEAMMSKRTGDRTGTVRVSVRYDTGGPAFESHRTWVYHNDVMLRSRDGQSTAALDGSKSVQEADGATGIEYRFRNIPEPIDQFEFVDRVPTLITDHHVEFDFQDVELPSNGRNVLP